jgi:hypothetical protein
MVTAVEAPYRSGWKRQVSEMASGDSERTYRLQILVSPEEWAAIDDFRFQSRLPNRSAAIRALLDRGMSTEETPTDTRWQ